jgi:hypothetical protein
MRPHGEGFLDDLPTATTPLRGKGGFHRQHRNVVECAIVAHPTQEGPPSRVVDGLGKVPVALHIAYLKVFVVK